MDRRIKKRLNLQLVCRIGREKILSTPILPAEAVVTENFSRTGILLRWLPDVPLPSIGCRLTVDVDLPCPPGFAPRVMRCASEVVRFEVGSDAEPLVGLAIGKIRFVRGARAAAARDLKSLPPASALLN